MPIKQSAKKYMRITKKNNARNTKKKDAFKAAVKKTRTAITGQAKEEALKLYREAQKTIDKAAKRGVIKRNTAARKKSRLAKKISALAK